MKKQKSAFTLAEVLITLGIIGVVAALTIPALVQNHRKHVVETRLEKFYSAINQAISLAESEFGERENWDWKQSDITEYVWFNKYLSKYIKTVSVKEYENHKAIVYFLDDSLVVLSKLGINFYPNSKDFIYCNNLEDYQYCSGTKMFVFRYAPNNVNTSYILDSGINAYKYENRLVEPYKYGWDGTENGIYGLRTHNSFGCKAELPTNGRAYCTALIQANGWKIPDDYPLKF